MTSLNPTGNWRHGLGEVAEWSKANDSKSFEGKPSVGSNPTLSVLKRFWGYPGKSWDGSVCLQTP